MADDPTHGSAEPALWLLLLHQLPPKPAYFRVKIWRRLQGLGAVLVKNAVYALPANEQTREDFEWLLKEINEGGGEALICEARLVDGISDQEIRAQFNAARGADYEAVAKDARGLVETLSVASSVASPISAAEGKAKLARLKAEMTRLEAIDFFGANGREAADGLIAALERRLSEEPTLEPVTATRAAHELRGKVWVTRQGVHVDRIASAWLIRRFIDPDATFKFVPGKRYQPEAGEIRFDMFEAEFTHEGDRCTFEVLLARTGLADPALTAIAEMVHDIDLKDDKFGREETPGIDHLIAGISIANQEDETRLARGSAVFDDLYEYLRNKHP